MKLYDVEQMDHGLFRLPVTSKVLFLNIGKKGKRKVQGVPQSQAAALPRHQEEEETHKTKRKRKQTKPNKRKSNKRTKSTKISSLFPKRGYRNAKRTEKRKNKITKARLNTNRLVE